jgi:hypothetical protein
MEIVKKNLVSIICGVIALAAIAVAFTMVSSRQAQLQADLNARKQVHDQLADLLKKDRSLPTVDPDKPTAEKLTKFPSQKIIDQGEQITKQVTAESNAMGQAASQMNKHEPIVPGALPHPINNAVPFQFRNRYQQFFALPTTNPTNGLLAKELQAGTPPLPDEITAKLAEQANTITQKRLIIRNGQPVNQQQVQEEIAQAAKKLPEDLRQQIARNSKVYINRETFQPYAEIFQAQGLLTPEQMYFAQLSLWLQQDVVAAVKEANGGAKSIIDAPVKHLIHVTTPPNFILPASGTPAADPDAALPKEAVMSPTGRVCNGLYDVFHFEIEVDVEAARLPDFLRVLGHNRFITPLWVDVRSVDNATELAAGRVYGDRPVINCRIRCENLYLRAWHKQYMPQRIREKLAIPADAAPGTEGAPGAAPAAPAAPPAEPAAMAH